MDKAKIVLRPGVQLIEYDHPDALFSYYGNPHFQKFTGSSFPIVEFLDFVAKPRTKKEVERKFSSFKGFAKNFEGLLTEDFFVEGSLRRMRSKNDPLTHFCSNFHHSLDISDKMLKECASRQLCIVDHLGVAKKMMGPLSDLKIKRVKILRSHEELEAHKADMILILSGWQNVHQLTTFNRWCLENKKEYFLILMDMFGGSIGPMLGRKHGPCFTCLQARRNSNIVLSRRTMVERLEKWAAEQGRVETGLFPPFTKILLQMAAVEVFKWFARVGDNHGIFGLKEVDLLNIRTEYHEILPTPRCPMCFPRQNLAL